MFNIKTLNKISPLGMEKFDRNSYAWGDDIENPEAILVRSASMHDMEMPESLLAIARAGAGVNNIPLDVCAEKGIVVFNTPGANANAVKELVLLGLLLSSRKVAPAMDWVKTLKGQGAEVGKLVEKGKSNFAGKEVYRKKLGVIGLGAIGALVANIGLSMGMIGGAILIANSHKARKMIVDGQTELRRKLDKLKNCDCNCNCDCDEKSE